MYFSWNPSAVTFEINHRNQTDVFFIISILQVTNKLKSEQKLGNIIAFDMKTSGLLKSLKSWS